VILILAWIVVILGIVGALTAVLAAVLAAVRWIQD
jgi:hypothetical protein